MELKIPLAAIAYNNSNISVPPRDGDYWRINFSRVQWRVHAAAGGRYYALGDEDNSTPTCVWPCPSGTPSNPGDNWVWAPTGVVDVRYF